MVGAWVEKERGDTLNHEAKRPRTSTASTYPLRVQTQRDAISCHACMEVQKMGRNKSWPEATPCPRHVASTLHVFSQFPSASITRRATYFISRFICSKRYKYTNRASRFMGLLNEQMDTHGCQSHSRKQVDGVGRPATKGGAGATAVCFQGSTCSKPAKFSSETKGITIT